MEKAKKHDVKLKIFITDVKSCYLIIFFSNSYLVINIGKVKLNKTFNLTQVIQRFTYKKKKIPIFDALVIWILIINI